LTQVRSHAAKVLATPGYALPKTVADAKKNSASNPSQQKLQGSSGVQTGGKLDPQMANGPQTLTPTIGNDVSDFQETEGYHPPLGYFKQSPECDAAMRAWLPNCAFVDHPKSLYWESTEKNFPPKEKPETSANYIGNMYFNDEAERALGENSQDRQVERKKENSKR